jgi:HTH-type transcriptional regulator, quorum sensing regulator NprR
MWGEKIYYFRKKNGLTQSELASGICSVSYLSKVERNSIEPSHDIIIPICERLNIQIDDHQTIEDIQEQLIDLYEEISEKNFSSVANNMDQLQIHMKWIEDPKTIALFNLLRSKYAMSKKELTIAKDHLDFVEQIADRLDAEGKYYYYSFQGLYNYLMGHFKSSLDFHTMANKLRKELNLTDPYFVYQLALIYSNTKSYSKSIAATHEALNIFNSKSSFTKSVDCLILLGINYNRIGSREEAKSYFFQALKASKHLSNRKELCFTVNHNLGYVFSSEGLSLEAIKYYQNALDLNSESIPTLYLIAKEYYLINHIENSLKYVHMGKNCLKNESTTYSFKLSLLLLKLNKLQESVEYEHLLIKSLNFFEKKKDEINQLEVYVELGKYYEKKFSYKNATKYFKKALELGS